MYINIYERGRTQLSCAPSSIRWMFATGMFSTLCPSTELRISACGAGDLVSERIFVERMTSDRKLKASREGSK